MLAGLGRLQAFGAVLRVVALTRGNQVLLRAPGGVRRGDLATGVGSSCNISRQPGHNLFWHTGRKACKPLCRTRHPIGDGSVQQSLYAAGGALGFYRFGLAADERYSFQVNSQCPAPEIVCHHAPSTAAQSLHSYADSASDITKREGFLNAAAMKPLTRFTLVRSMAPHSEVQPYATSFNGCVAGGIPHVTRSTMPHRTQSLATKPSTPCRGVFP